MNKDPGAIENPGDAPSKRSVETPFDIVGHAFNFDPDLPVFSIGPSRELLSQCFESAPDLLSNKLSPI
jgi:hypothetical protein